MKAVFSLGAGGPEVLQIKEISSLPLKPGCLRIAVRATSVNRADILQRKGLYPPPQGHSPILGLECAGEVAQVGSDVTEWKVGDRAMALLDGGGYAEEAVVDARHALHIPACMSLEEAGGFMETFLTADFNLFGLAALCQGENALIHGGSGGVGTAAIALLRESALRCFVTAGSEDRCVRCLGLGAELAINYRTQDFAKAIAEATQGNGTNVILDCIGGRYFASNLSALAPDGRLVIIGLLGGKAATIELAHVLTKRIRIIGSLLRSQTTENKARLILDFRRRFGFALDQGRLRPVIDRKFSLCQVSDAHRWLETQMPFGKVILTI